MKVQNIKIFNYLLFLIAVPLFLLSCKKTKVISSVDYNEKANELIRQVIADNPCGCILEIPKESMIQINEEENPIQNIRENLIKKLKLSNESSLDSLDKLYVQMEFYLLQNQFLINLIKQLR